MRGRSRVFFVAALVASAIAAGVGVACIPDLHVQKLTPPTPPACGNGFVDLDAGEQCDPGQAGAVGCSSTCTVECDGGLLDDGTGHCYFALSALTYSYLNASSGCDLASAHIVTFASREELAMVAAWNAQRTGQPVWIGMRAEANTGWVPVADVDEPGWTTGCAGCFAAVDDGGAFPQPLDASSPCLQIAPGATGGPWQRVPCAGSGGLKRTVCEREPPGVLSQSCDGGVCIDLRRTIGRKRYLYVATKTLPDDASAQCQLLPNGHLVVLESREEREQLWAELARIDDGLKQIWIGLARDDDAGRDWRWDDGVALDAGRPVPWGLGANVDGGTPRAYLERLAGAGVVDSQLARNVDRFGATLPTELPFVCQFGQAP